jgi:sulfoxide reductase heme-binding subunit YedZ
VDDKGNGEQSSSLRQGPLGWQQLRILAHAVAWLPALGAVTAFLTHQLTVNPIQDLMQRTGRAALILLLLSLACTPIQLLTGHRSFAKLRRMLGLYALLYAGLHFGIFLAIDYAFNLRLIWIDLRNKAYIYAGVSAGLILLALGATSSRWAQSRLGRNWTRLHRLVYLAAGLAVLHFAWARKGDVFALRGDIVQPLAAAGLLGLLLALRLPPVKHWIQRVRQMRAGDTPSAH